MWVDSGTVVFEGVHVGASWKKYTAYEGDGDGGWGGGGSYLYGFLELAYIVGRLRENFMYRQCFLWISVVQKGTKPLPRCDLYGMHMPAEQLIKHRRMQRYNRTTQMRWRRRYVAIVSRYAEAPFRLMGDNKVDYTERVDTLKYLGRMLD